MHPVEVGVLLDNLPYRRGVRHISTETDVITGLEARHVGYACCTAAISWLTALR